MLSSLSDKNDSDNFCNANVKHDVYIQIGQYNTVEHKAVKGVVNLALKEMCQWAYEDKSMDLCNWVGERSMYVTR